MARKGLLYFLFSSTKKPLYEDHLNQIVEGTEDFKKLDGITPAHLKISPDGWKDKLVKYARNITYWGIFRDMTIPMRFVKDGAKILKNRMWTFGYEVVCQLGMLKLDRQNMPYRYTGWYLSEINFTKYKQNRHSVSVEALEGGLSKYFKAYENTPFEIPVNTDDEKVAVLFDGVNLYGKHNYISITDDDFIFEEDILPFEIAFPWTQLSHEGEPPYASFFTEMLEQALIDNSVFKYVAESSNYIHILSTSSPVPVELKFRGKIRWKITTLRTVKTFRLTFWQVPAGAAPTVPPLIRTILFTLLVNDLNVHEYVINFDVTVNPGDKLFWTWDRNPAASPSDLSSYKFVEGTELTIEFKTKYQPTIAYGLRPGTVAKRLLDKITGGKYTHKSDFLDAMNDIVLMSGDNVRQIETGVIKTSISDFFKSFNHWCIGMGIENEKLRIELFAYFFQSGIIMQLGEVVDCELVVAEDLLFNTIGTGGPTEEYDDVNGKYEFNQGQVWITEALKAIKQLDLKTPYRRDCYGIEFLRKSLERKDTTDSSSDNSVFMVNIETNLQPAVGDIPEHYKLYRPAFTTLEGVPDDTVFNTLLTPKHSILNNGVLIRNVLDMMDATKIKMTSKDKNAELRTVLAGSEVDQDKEITVGSLPERLWKPYYFIFTAQVPQNLLEIMESTPYGRVEFIVDEKKYYGFLCDGGIKPATRDKYQFKLLSAPENDLSKFYE